MIVFYHSKFDETKPERYDWFNNTNIEHYDIKGHVIRRCILGIDNARINVSSTNNDNHKHGYAGQGRAYRQVLIELAVQVHIKEELNKDV